MEFCYERFMIRLKSERWRGCQGMPLLAVLRKFFVGLPGALKMCAESEEWRAAEVRQTPLA